MKKKIIVFGRGRYFEEKKEELYAKYSIKEIWDNSIRRGVKDYHENIPVINPLDADRIGTEPVYLLSVRFIEMWRFLINNGMTPDRLVVPYDIPNLYENDEAIQHCVRKIEFSRENVIVTTSQNEKLRVGDEAEWRELLQVFYRNTYPVIEAVSQMDTTPISGQFGTERGTPVDRYYIEQFLNEHREYIKGTILEIEDNLYTCQFAENNYKSIVLNVDSGSTNIDFIANLETGEGIREKVADCFICTQTLMYIYDIRNAVENIYRLLKPGGVVLLTCSGISQNSRRCMDNYGCTFNYNVDAIKKMFGNRERFEMLSVGSYGNVKTVCAHLAGLCQEDLREDAFLVNDKYYPLVVYAAVRRVG